MTLEDLLLALRIHWKDNASQYFSEARKLVTLLTCKLLIFYYTISTAPEKPIYFPSELILDWGLAYKYGTNCSLISQHSKVLDKTKIIEILGDNFFISYFWSILNLTIFSVFVYSVARSCSTLCEPIDYRPPGTPVHGIFQARILEWVAISYSRGSF